MPGMLRGCERSRMCRTMSGCWAVINGYTGELARLSGDPDHGLGAALPRKNNREIACAD